MNLSYIINNIKNIITRNDVIKTTHHIYPTQESGNGAEVDCAGYNTMTLCLTGSTLTLRTFNIYVEGLICNHWEMIPVYNSKRVVQPYIAYNNNRLAYDEYTSNIYFANICGYEKVRTRLEFISGNVGVSVDSIITNAPFQIERHPATILDIKNSTSILTKDHAFISMPVSIYIIGTDTGNAYPVWIGDVDFCEIVLENNTNKELSIPIVSLHDKFNSPISDFAYQFSVDQTAQPGETIRINSFEYPVMTQYQGISATLRQFGCSDDSSGSYNLKINIK